MELQGCAGGRVIKAIVVDDNKDVRDVFTELLQISGVNVVGNGANGKDGVELYQKHHPDIVFMDVMMDKFDGYYGIEKIREYDPQARVVLVTGSIDVEEKLMTVQLLRFLKNP